MSPALALIAIVVLAVLLAVVSAIAGALWWRTRSLPLTEAVVLARALMARRRALEDLLERVAAAAAQQGPSRGEVPPARAHQDQALPPAPRLIAVPDLSAPKDPVAKGHAERNARVLELADAGTSSEEIARLTNQPVGQVELILGLRRRLTRRDAAEGRP